MSALQEKIYILLKHTVVTSLASLLKMVNPGFNQKSE